LAVVAKMASFGNFPVLRAGPAETGTDTGDLTVTVDLHVELAESLGTNRYFHDDFR
jgi:hypothetical protein